MQSEQSLASDVAEGRQASAAEARPADMKRVASASFVGTLIEFYDVSIYGFAAALVFGKVFFPALGAASATVAAFATLGVAFVARPIGAVIFGHFGDRLGRKNTLITTLIMMGIATALVGVMPTAEQIGIAAPIILVVLRIVQGLAAGGEWAGAALFAAENAPKAKRGFWAMFASLGGAVALVIAPLTFLPITLMMSDEAFLNYGWRIPFIASLALVAVGLWMRLRMEETPVFQDEQNRGETARVPIAAAFKSQPRQILLAAGAMIVIFSFGQLGTAYLVTYGTVDLSLSRTFVLAIGSVGAIGYTLAILFGGTISDRIGRRPIVIAAAAAGVVWALALFPILDTGSQFAFGLGVIGSLIISGAALGPMSAYTSELFHTRYRYTAAGFCYNLAGIIGGALTPILAASITATYGGFAFGVLLACLSLVSLLSVLRLGETKGRELNEDSTTGIQP
ncbi:MFS transporter [Rhodococcus opacus]|uniref:MFS transporter n=1 Tax=Rhodococcus opacus TaxID=37919 RepID=UPI0024739D05|nr:MFS transporter [Rhodococcus opacus]MDH6293309.1 MFS family permease [Rhodococcus opacus]